MLATYDSNTIVTYYCANAAGILSPSTASNQCVNGVWIYNSPSCFGETFLFALMMLKHFIVISRKAKCRGCCFHLRLSKDRIIKRNCTPLQKKTFSGICRNYIVTALKSQPFDTFIWLLNSKVFSFFFATMVVPWFCSHEYSKVWKDLFLTYELLNL